MTPKMAKLIKEIREPHDYMWHDGGDADTAAKKLADLVEENDRNRRRAWTTVHSQFGLVLRHLGETTEQASEICDKILKQLWED